MEIWKDVVDFERAYQVSNLGRVKSKIRSGVIAERLLKPFKCLDTGEAFASASEAARQKGCSQSNITSAVLGKRNKAGGLRWSYDFGGEE